MRAASSRYSGLLIKKFINYDFINILSLHNEFSAYQTSPRREVIKVQVVGECVFLAGQAVTVMRGTLI